MCLQNDRYTFNIGTVFKMASLLYVCDVSILTQMHLAYGLGILSMLSPITLPNLYYRSSSGKQSVRNQRA